MISNRNIDEFITCAIDILENEKEIVKNGKIKKISGDVNPADLGFHK